MLLVHLACAFAATTDALTLLMGHLLVCVRVCVRVCVCVCAPCQVSLLSIARPEAEATFITLTTSANTTLALTPEHHLPVGSVCCTTLRKAKDVEVGETLWIVDGGATVRTQVVQKSLVIEKGLHSPVLAHGGYPVVNGVATAFDSLGGVWLMGALGPYLEPLLKATGGAAIFRRVFLAAGRKYIDGLEVDASERLAPLHAPLVKPLAASVLAACALRLAK